MKISQVIRSKAAPQMDDPARHSDELGDGELERLTGGTAAKLTLEHSAGARRPNCDGVVLLHSSLPGGD